MPIKLSKIDAEVLERDKGVCHKCKLDTVWLASLFVMMRKGYPEGRKHKVDLLMGWMGYNTKKRLWQRDHIIPKAEGGNNSLKNQQTLCVPCHKGKTSTDVSTWAKGNRLIKKKPGPKLDGKIDRLKSKKPKVRCV